MYCRLSTVLLPRENAMKCSPHFRETSQVPVKGKSSVCAISMKYRKMILIIIIISLGQILLSYIANTSRTRIRTRPPSTIAVQVVDARWVSAPNHDEVNAPFSVLHSNKQSRMGRGIRDRFGCFSRINKFLGRSEMRTRDRICFQSIRTV